MSAINKLSPSWLTEVLQSEGVIEPEVSIDAYESQVLQGGLMADTQRLTLQYVNGTGNELAFNHCPSKTVITPS